MEQEAPGSRSSTETAHIEPVVPDGDGAAAAGDGAAAVGGATATATTEIAAAAVTSITAEYDPPTGSAAQDPSPSDPPERATTLTASLEEDTSLTEDKKPTATTTTTNIVPKATTPPISESSTKENPPASPTTSVEKVLYAASSSPASTASLPPEGKKPGAVNVDETVIDSRVPNDVICGRGTTGSQNEANKAYRQLLKEHSKGLVSNASEVIVQAVLAKQGRFIRYDEKRSVWLDVGYHQAIKKTIKALKKRRRREDERQNQADNEDTQDVEEVVEVIGDSVAYPTTTGVPDKGDSEVGAATEIGAVAAKSPSKKREDAAATSTTTSQRAEFNIPQSKKREDAATMAITTPARPASKKKSAQSIDNTTTIAQKKGTEGSASPSAVTAQRQRKRRRTEEESEAGENTTKTAFSPTHRLMIRPLSTPAPTPAATAKSQESERTSQRLAHNQQVKPPPPAAPTASPEKRSAPTTAGESLMAQYAKLQECLELGMSPAEAAAMAAMFDEPRPVHQTAMTVANTWHPSLEQQLQQQQQQQDIQHRLGISGASGYARTVPGGMLAPLILAPSQLDMLMIANNRMGWGTDLAAASHATMNRPHYPPTNYGMGGNSSSAARLLERGAMSLPPQQQQQYHLHPLAAGEAAGLASRGGDGGGDSGFQAQNDAFHGTGRREFTPYIEENWDRLLQHCYEDIPETRLQVPPQAKNPKLSEGAAFRHTLDEEARGAMPCTVSLARQGQEQPSQYEDADGDNMEGMNEEDGTGDDDDDEHGEEEAEEADADEAPTIYTFDDGRKWKAERIKHMVILSPYLA